MQEMQIPSLGWCDPWRRKWLPTPVFLPGESHGQRSLAGYSSWGRKASYMTEHTRICCYSSNKDPYILIKLSLDILKVTEIFVKNSTSLDFLENLEDLAILDMHPIVVTSGPESWLPLACATQFLIVSQEKACFHCLLLPSGLTLCRLPMGIWVFKLWL